jgi:hypothetical protein
VACYIQTPDNPAYQPFSLVVLQIQDSQIAELSVFGADLFPTFDLSDEPSAGVSSNTHEGR